MALNPDAQRMAPQDTAPEMQQPAPLHHAHWPPGQPHDIDLPNRTIIDSLEDSARRVPDKACMVYYDSITRFADCRDTVRKLAAFLQQECGVSPGDRVLLYLQNCPQFVMAFHAVLRCGGVVVPVNPMTRSGELAHYVDDSGARTIVAGSEVAHHALPFFESGALQHGIVVRYADALTQPTTLALPDVLRAEPAVGIPACMHTWTDATAIDASRLQPVPVAPDDLCVMPYTSGTTGHPKGCMHTHRSVLFTAMAGMQWMGMQQDDVILGAMPYFHVTGMQRCMNGPLHNGSTTIIMTRWDARVAAALIERYQVTAWTGVPTMYIDLLGNPELEHVDLSSLQRISGGGAAMPPAIAQRMAQRLGGDYIEGYGLSETIAPSHINPPHRRKQQTLGIPIFNTRSCVIDPDTCAVLGPNTVGEIAIHGPQVFQGYWRNESATDEAFTTIDGERYFRTGDLGYVDEDGYFHMVDRLKRMINASGFKVWPAEVEALLHDHPAVKEVCVIAASDPHRGETVKALIVAHPHASAAPDAAALMAWAREHMAAYKAPRIVEFVTSLPKSATGKVEWRALQERERGAQPT